MFVIPQHRDYMNGPKQYIIGQYGYNAQSDDLRQMLGLAPKAKLPEAGMAPQTVQGFKVWVEPLVRPEGSRRKSSKHRVLAQCPDCRKVVSAGRLHQHKCQGGV